MREVDRGDSVRVPLLWIAMMVSLLLHGGLMWRWREVALPPTPERQGKGSLTGRLRAQIAPPPAAARERAAPPPPPPASERPRASAAPPRAARSPPPPPREQLARQSPGPARAQPPPAPAPAPPENDFSAALEANRRRREGPAPAPAPASEAPARQPGAEDENARRDRTIAANLGSLKAPMVGENSRHGGGVFQIRHVGMEDAEFLFFGWNKDMARNNTQLVEVRRGNNPDMRIAVVRRMIVLIREHEKGDFVWESRRMRRNVNLSARVADTAELEAFLMAEFF
jgi:hypothetical protein